MTPVPSLSQTEAAAYQRGVADTLALAEAVSAALPSLLPAGHHQPVTLAQLADALARVDDRSLQVLRPFNPAEGVSPKEAAALAGRSESAIRQWVERYRIGRRVVGSMIVSRIALAALLDDNPVALAAYLSGDRSSSLVAPYLSAVR